MSDEKPRAPAGGLAISSESEQAFLDRELDLKFPSSIHVLAQGAVVRDERLEMLKWHHLKVEIDNREKDWPEGSHYDFDYEKQTVAWFFGKQRLAPKRLVFHMTRDQLWSNRPSDVAARIVRQANKVATEEI